MQPDGSPRADEQAAHDAQARRAAPPPAPLGEARVPRAVKVADGVRERLVAHVEREGDGVRVLDRVRCASSSSSTSVPSATGLVALRGAR